MERKDFYTDPADPKGNKLKAMELGRRHALTDAIEGERRKHSIDASPDYVKSYEKHRGGLKEHEHPYWSKGK